MASIDSAKGRRQRQRASRHQAQNRRRGVRAREHLARARERERSRLRRDARFRERARHGRSLSERAHRAARLLLFGGAGIAGLLLARPILQTVAPLAGQGLGSVETISIQNNALLSSELIAGLTEIAPGSPLAAVDAAAVERRLEAHPWIREAHALVLPPGALLVRVEERTPVALLSDAAPASGGQPGGRLVDETGTPFARVAAADADAEALPRLAGGSSLADAESHPVLVRGLELLAQQGEGAAAALDRPDRRIELWLPSDETPDGWVLRSADRSFEVVLGRRTPEAGLERLAELLRARPPVLGDAPIQIDLRFASQAVLRSPGPPASGGDTRS